MNARRLIGLSLLSCAASLVMAASASAQGGTYGRPYSTGGQQPTISPYLNMLRPGNQAANYFLLVRPEFQQRALNSQFGSALQDLERRATQPPDPTLGEDLLPTLPSTGHGTAFGYSAGYFGGGGGMSRQGSGQGGVGMPPQNRGRR